MRNLKKVLSLVLALAMVLSICMVGAGAVNYDDFTDEESITKKQAVETLVSLDVIKGYNDGATFNPTGNVTRAEMATMICRILAGGDNMIVDATKPVPTYTDIRNNPSAAWAESYIEYCTSLGIVSGKGNGIFDPSADVTAAEAAKMVMTTLGYNADVEQFKGIGWDINTMAKANTLKLLDNLQGEISSSVPVTREQVAQLLYNALSLPMVQNYVGNTANLWIGSGANAYQQTLLESKFNAQKIVGVVVANEWADLYGEDPLAAGRTRVRALGTDNMPTNQEYTVNLSTSLEQVGESIIVYRDTTSNRILFGNDQSTDLNVVNEYTAKGDITSSKDFENAISKDSLTKNTEYFVNYDIGYSTTSDYRIGYTVTLSQLDEAAKVKGFEDLAGLSAQIKANGGKDKPNGGTLAADKYDKIIRPGDEITSLDLTIIKAIFDAAGLTGTAEADNKKIEVGEVYVGTQSNKDISDETSYSKFQDTYLDSNLAKNKIVSNDNGNYIKTVDYNGDGEVDYVLKTIYNTTNVERVKDNGNITLYLDNVPSSDINAKSKIDSYAPYDDLAKDDIVVYAVIDGIAHVYLCDTVTAKIDKVNRNTRTATTTDGDDYVESDVKEYIDEDLVFQSGVRNLAGSVSYNLYFDRYGYLTAFTEATSGTYTLLINGWFNYARGGREYAVKAYIDGETVDRDVKKNGDLFIYDDDDDAGKNNSWELIKRLGGANTALNAENAGNKLTTIIASLSEDGILTPVDLIYNNQNKRMVNMIATKDNKIPMRDYVEGTTYTTDTRTGSAYTVTGSKVEVRGLNSTVYYCVYPGQGNNDPIVRAYNGYNSLRLTKDDEKLIEDVYVVGSRVNRDSDLDYTNTYYTAEAVVIEFKAQTQGRAREVFVVDMPVVGGSVQLDELQIIDEDGTEKTVTVDLTKSDYRTVGQVIGTGDASSYGIAGGKTVMPGLYYLYETNEKDVYTIKTMDHEDIDTARYAVGRVNTSRGTASDLFAGVVRYTFDKDGGYDDKVYLDKDGKQVEVNKDITDTTGLYNLSYRGVDSGIEAKLDKQTSWRDVLYEYVDRVERGTLDREFQLPDRGATKYDANYNDVLIRYSGNNIVYAVSFANMINSSLDYTGADTTPNNRNFAQIVWDNVKPVDKEKNKAAVSFYGDTTPDVTGGTTITVDWKTASDWAADTAHEKNLEVKDATSVKVVDSRGNTVKDVTPNKDGETYTLTFVDEKDEVQIYKLVQEAASDVAGLSYDREKTGTFTNLAAESQSNFPSEDKLTLPEFQARVKKSDSKATMTWYWTDVDDHNFTTEGDVITSGDTYYRWRIDQITSVRVVVTSENGDIVKTYYFGTKTLKNPVALSVKLENTAGIMVLASSDPTDAIAASTNDGTTAGYSLEKGSKVWFLVAAGNGVNGGGGVAQGMEWTDFAATTTAKNQRTWISSERITWAGGAAVDPWKRTTYVLAGPYTVEEDAIVRPYKLSLSVNGGKPADGITLSAPDADVNGVKGQNVLAENRTAEVKFTVANGYGEPAYTTNPNADLEIIEGALNADGSKEYTIRATNMVDVVYTELSVKSQGTIDAEKAEKEHADALIPEESAYEVDKDGGGSVTISGSVTNNITDFNKFNDNIMGTPANAGGSAYAATSIDLTKFIPETYNFTGYTFKIVQKNPALALYGAGGNITNSGGVWTKTASGYAWDDIGTFCFLLIPDQSVVFEITPVFAGVAETDNTMTVRVVNGATITVS